MNSVTVDDSGNIYCAGYTRVEPWEKPMGESNDAFVMKLNSSGDSSMGDSAWGTQPLQAEEITLESDRNVNSIAMDDSGNIYCAGIQLEP